MGYLFQIDEENVRSLHIQMKLDTGFNVLYYMMGHAYNSRQYPDNALEIAKGFSVSYGSGYKEVAKKLSGRVITTDDIPILIDASTTLSYETSTKDVLNFSRKASRPKSPSEIFPIAVRYISKDGTYFIERPPSEISIDFRNGSRAGTNFPKKIWIPWTLMAINPMNLSRPKLYFSSSPLQSMDSKYIPSLLPNTYADGALCFAGSLNGMHANNNQENKNDIRWLFSSMFNEFISGGWNTDLGPNISFLYYFNDLSEKVKEKFPMISKFFSVTCDEIVKANPHIRKSSINGLVQIRGRYTSRVNQFKYMFLAMSTFTLEETLAFYEEIELISPNQIASDIISFDNIVHYSDDIVKPISKFANLQNAIRSNLIANDIKMNDLVSGQQNRIQIILHNYSNQPNFNRHMRHAFYSIQDYISDHIDLKVYMDILDDSLKRPPLYAHVYLWDYDNGTFEYCEDSRFLSCSQQIIDDYYYDFVKEKYSIPLEEWEDQQNSTTKNTLQMEA